MSVRFDADGEDYTSTAGIPSGSYTLLCWVMVSVDRDFFSLISAVDDGGTGAVYHHLGTTDDGVTLVLGDSAGTIALGAALTVGTWYRVAYTVSGTTGTLYWGTDTGSLSSAGGTVTDVSGFTTIRIGESMFGGAWFNGRVANLKHYSAALTQTEIETELRSWTAVRTSGLVRHHKFQTAETTDYSGNGNTLSGGTGASTEADPPINRVAVDLVSTATGAVLTTAGGGTTIAPTYPTLTVDTGQLACYYAVLHVRGAGRTVTTPANWTLVGSFASTNTSSESADVGPTRTHIYKRTSTTALSSTQSFTISAQTTSGVAQGYIRGYVATGTNVAYEELLLGWSNPTTGTTSGSTTPDGSLTVTAGQVAAKDQIDISVGISSDSNTSLSVGSITCTGATIGTASSTATRTTTVAGNDLTTAGFTAAVTAGTNTGTTLTVPVTQAPANQMHGLVHRIRATAVAAELPPPRVLTQAALVRAHYW